MMMTSASLEGTNSSVSLSKCWFSVVSSVVVSSAAGSVVSVVSVASVVVVSVVAGSAGVSVLAAQAQKPIAMTATRSSAMIFFIFYIPPETCVRGSAAEVS